MLRLKLMWELGLEAQQSGAGAAAAGASNVCLVCAAGDSESKGRLYRCWQCLQCFHTDCAHAARDALVKTLMRSGRFEWSKFDIQLAALPPFPRAALCDVCNSEFE
eukprot:9490348-Pyramimonas_sp.AAC.1